MRYHVALDHDGCLRKDNLFQGNYDECKEWIRIHYHCLVGEWGYVMVSEESGRAVSYVL